MAVLRNITRRKQAEEALRESEERFQEMARNIDEIFWTLDAENMKVLNVNPAYETITGRSCESLEEDPKSYEEVIHPERHERRLSFSWSDNFRGTTEFEMRLSRFTLGH